ncbi:HlyD family secretion protein [Bordetella pseudohinzii]|uniref:Acriflavine resistance protein A n=1 Tax=Bordetella pseudohinzii TaxID=1331258 RepID=A0A0J6C917_9BORD|nr:HlyD family secretion protein [Bordetella pseudohinzii]ANY16411.1 efflux transporter periplasmic adaptor subunit [Bordetella pseudohinzii]KMM27553.1 membrane protein [Bordetella pseudohinzii]KXA78203.1 efflux transporter periplasmic adaptor subunit [Bordetella pseudohinzii]KXA82017.1 efflux transporter periplasmic adaptor subunit [Bordetella pseudohinzii]CUI37615.1 Acriflavine resistance protein A precursor [Bordetella pseudohinzii]
MKLPNSLRPAALGRYAVTALAVLAAVYAGWQLWVHYEVEPWTRDGRVKAYVVQVAPDVSGLVTAVPVQDNQDVKAGDILFEIDRARFQLAFDQADAAVRAEQVAREQATRDVKRNRSLGQLVSAETLEQSQTRLQQTEAALAQAEVQLNVARLNLQRSRVLAAVDGRVTNLDLRVGSYASAGRAVMALVDAGSFYVEGYFEETKLPNIHEGDPVLVTLMGESRQIRGHVESVAMGIADRDRSTSANLLPNVNPTFNWVRLAQRIPVRVRIDEVPEGVRLVAGQTATVAIDTAALAAKH